MHSEKCSHPYLENNFYLIEFVVEDIDVYIKDVHCDAKENMIYLFKRCAVTIFSISSLISLLFLSQISSNSARAR
jgi:hypothetical protein